MLTLRALSDGKNYSARHLQYSDYLDKNAEVIGEWRGKGAAALGLSGQVTHDQFRSLAECEHPVTGEFLRQRRSADRVRADGSKQSEAVSLFDLTCSAPKSISIAGMEDSLLAEAHEAAVAEMLAEVESLAAVEDKRGGQKRVRTTGNLVIATYEHTVSRQLDAQYHSHIIVFNLSHDAETGQHRALHSPTFYQRRAYFTNIYRNALARNVMALGYEIENGWNKKGTDYAFEIKGIWRALIEKFSKRSKEKEAAIAKFTEDKGREPSDDEVAVLVRETRDDELLEISTHEVQNHQRAQLTPEEAQLLRHTKEKAERRGVIRKQMSARQAIQFSKEHLFERSSVVHDYELLSAALEHGRGQVSLDKLKEELQIQQKRGDLVVANGRVATRESIDREARAIAIVNRGTGRFERLGGKDHQYFASTVLTEEQNAAVEYILNSKDMVTCLQGAAGTGKTETLRRVRRAAFEAGQEMTAIAPTKTAVSELRDRGFTDAMTIERLLQDPKARERVYGKVIVVDEAGMVGSRQMLAILEMAKNLDCRVLLVGDTQQIRPVEAGDSLQILQQDSTLKTVELRRAQRQSEKAMGGKYRAISETLWRDREGGFQMLDEAGAIKTVDYLDRPQATVDAVVQAKKTLAADGRGDCVLCVAPTHSEIDRYNEAIRARLDKEGKLLAARKLSRLEAINWTLAKRRHAQSYKPGMVLAFHKATSAVKKNETFTVVGTDRGWVICRSDKTGKEVSFSKKQAASFGVFRRRQIDVAIGDQLLLQTNVNQRGLKIENGEIVAVEYVDDDRRIHLKDGRVLPADYQQFKHGYAVTRRKEKASMR